jgi:transcriptional regulator with XRE-family HTH domain
MAKMSYELALIEEEAVAHVQAMALRLLAEKKITRSQLAAAMGVSIAHVSQLLGDDPQNLSIKKAARLFHHLGEQLVITCAGIERMNRQAEARNARMAAASAKQSKGQWRCFANDSEPARTLAAA